MTLCRYFDIFQQHSYTAQNVQGICTCLVFLGINWGFAINWVFAINWGLMPAQTILLSLSLASALARRY